MKVKKGILKILFVFLIIFLISIINIQPIYADDFNADDYKPISQTDVNNAEKLLTSANKIIGIVTWIGMVLSILVFVAIGVKYMLGSVEEKAEYKKTMFPYLIGAGLIFGITTIVKILSSLATSI